MADLRQDKYVYVALNPFYNNLFSYLVLQGEIISYQK